MSWVLRIMGEPCGHGEARTHDEAISAARHCLQQRPDYGSIVSLAQSGIPVDVHLEPPIPSPDTKE